MRSEKASRRGVPDECRIPDPPRLIRRTHREREAILATMAIVDYCWRKGLGFDEIYRRSPLVGLGHGVSRVVFELPGDEVVKIEYGLYAPEITPNRKEARRWSTVGLSLASALCPVRAMGSKGAWLVMPRVDPLSRPDCPAFRLMADDICRALGIEDCHHNNWGVWCGREVLIDYAE